MFYTNVRVYRSQYINKFLKKLHSKFSSTFSKLKKIKMNIRKMRERGIGSKEYKNNIKKERKRGNSKVKPVYHG